MSVTVCTVTLGEVDQYLKVFLHSLLRHNKYVREVIVVRVDGQETGILEEKVVDRTAVKVIGFPLGRGLDVRLHNFVLMVAGHALGLHHAIDNATSEYVWLSDPDIFFFSAVDQVYLDLMEQNDLLTIGIGHFWKEHQSYLGFPCVTNMMWRKKDLPSPDWMQGQLFLQVGMQAVEERKKIMPLDGKYLIPGLTEQSEEFPNPWGMFDVGCNLWLWNQEQQGKWLAFQIEHHQQFDHDNYGFKELVYPMNYSASYFSTNFDNKIALGEQPLLYHRTRCAQENPESFLKLYNQLLEEGRV